MWQIQDQTNGAALTCQQAGAMVVRLAIIPVDGGSGEVDAFSCDSGSALSREFTPGTYNATITLVGMAGAAPIATSMQSNVELVSGQSKALDAIIFQAAPIAP